MDEFLPHYDVIITGTGLTQSMVGAACARVGKSVFHCDQNDYYSQEWMSMNFQQIVNWCHTINSAQQTATETSDNCSASRATHLADSETSLRCARNSFVSDLYQISYLCDDEPCVDDDSNERESNADAGAVGGQQPSQSAVTPPNWTLFSFNLESRKFNLDLCPRLLFSRGSMVELLVSSNISRYAEFKAITRILTIIDDKLLEVPCSRGDIFNCKDVTVIEKRMLMKFMLFCSEYDKHYDEYKDYEQRPIKEFLTSQNLSEVLQKFILNAIAMTDESCPTINALKLINKFIHSAGRFGNTPFLFTLYGTGELPQAFCRLCAVFGGTYCLKKKVEAIVVDQQTNSCKGVVIDGKRINCDFLVTDYSINDLLVDGSDSNSGQKVSRAVIISNGSIKESESEQLTLLHIPGSRDDNHSSVHLIEVGNSALVAPKGLFVQYLWCTATNSNAKLDLLPVVKKLYNFTPEPVADKPKVLWSVYFTQHCSNPNYSHLPRQIYIPTPPINELDYDFAINEAKSIFGSMFANEEFLPRAPDPNEIIYDTDVEPLQNIDVEMNEANNNNMNAPVINNDHNNQINYI